MEKKILIVDDEVHIRALLEQTLEDLEDDYDVSILSAADGAEGLAMIREENPDLVFLDVMMPKMNGYDVCRTIKNEDVFRNLKIILLTAKGQEIDRKQGIDVGAYKYMTKPFDPDEILELAKQLLGLD
ncbi:response regulator [Desulfobacterales bacterium HSG17]|nr:response regulator [Desulfobacterales bacterium HSG17]